MDQRATYLLQMLETIGSPLMSAITSAQNSAQPASTQSEAQSMAALLGKTVEASIELGQIMEINPAEAQDDTLRVALAGLAGPLVAGQYARRAQVPESADLKKITGALQAVLTFSDNFTPTTETIERLKNLEASGQIVDSYQTQIQYMQAFIPVIEAIAAFPFGQAEAKLIMDVSTRLVKKSVELRETLLPSISDETVQKRAELGLLNALAALYSACHVGETNKVLNMDEEARAGGLSMEPVWSAFETRAAMLEAITARLASSGAVQNVQSSGGTSPATDPPAQVPAQPIAPPIEAAPANQAAQQPVTPPPAETPPTAPPTAPPAQAPVQAQEQSGAAGQNPMSMFAKPKDGAAETPTAPTAPVAPTAQTTQPPAAEPSPVTPPPVTTPTATSAAEPPVQPPADDGTEQPSGSPMSFFKKKDEE